MLLAAWVASIEWLVTTMSASAAAARALVGRHDEPYRQRAAPGHSAGLTDTCAQAASVGNPG
jgi:hypothetical protein